MDTYIVPIVMMMHPRISLSKSSSKTGFRYKHPKLQEATAAMTKNPFSDVVKTSVSIFADFAIKVELNAATKIAALAIPIASVSVPRIFESINKKSSMNMKDDVAKTRITTFPSTVTTLMISIDST